MPSRGVMLGWIMALAALAAGAPALRERFAPLLGLNAEAGFSLLVTGTLFYWGVASGLEEPAWRVNFRGWAARLGARLMLLAVTLPAGIALLARSFPLYWPELLTQLLWLTAWVVLCSGLAMLARRWYFALLLVTVGGGEFCAWLAGQLQLLRTGAAAETGAWLTWLPMERLRAEAGLDADACALAGALLAGGVAAAWAGTRRSGRPGAETGE